MGPPKDCRINESAAANGISHQLRLNHESYGPDKYILAAAHIYLAGPLDQLKNIGRPKAANIQFWYLRFENPYMTAAQLTGYCIRQEIPNNTPLRAPKFILLFKSKIPKLNIGGLGPPNDL